MEDIFDKAFKDFGNFFDKGIFAFSDCYCAADRLRTDEKRNKDGSYTVTAEAPGLTSEEIDIVYEDSVLSITVDYGEKSRFKKGKLSKSYRLPEIDSDKITAKMSNGILTIELPKSESSKLKKIKIN